MQVIGTEQELAAFLPALQAADWIAIDTEADSLHAYPEKLCLLQISLPGADVLVDPLARLDLAAVLDRLRSKELILHGADYDLRLLYRTYQFVPESIFDTMLAARLLGYREYGLSCLVGQHLGVTLEKGSQKMNWALRPLPDRMAAYALNDTRYLQALAELLRSRLQEKGRLEWHTEFCATLIKDCSRSRDEDPEDLWRIKGSDRLDRPGMAVLRELWRWREQEAVAANKPPYFIFSHENLVALASALSRGKPAHTAIPRHLTAQRAARLNAAIAKAVTTPPSAYPLPRRAPGIRLSRQERLAFDEHKRNRDVRAQELELDPTLIASKADLVFLAQGGGAAKNRLMRWQRRLLRLREGPENTGTKRQENPDTSVEVIPGEDKQHSPD